MASPGWYPDPAGGGGLRYWDGSSWTAPVKQPREPARRDGLLWWAIGILVVSLLVVLAVWQPWRPRAGALTLPEDTRSASPIGPSWDETSVPTESPQPTATALPTSGSGRPIDCPVGNGQVLSVQDGRYSSGGLSFQAVPGWRESRGYGLDMANDISGQQNRVTQGWVALTAIGWIHTSDFSNPRRATHQILECLSTSYYYRELDHNQVLEDREHNIGGRPGWIVRANMWNRQPHEVLGDEIIILVVDTGQEGKLALFHAEAPIGDIPRTNLINRALDSVQLS
ncbi:MAG: DUF2510 domain-containing protein [Propionibacteriaceae bacterium]|nr:DUF2510 domain-containing protein [Propionibacteriaceae bacterium]